ncbi:50S ribosomal protein L25/general stress protein Ctc [Robertmurraya andreesenii]|uniref:Large ribosomal subunit protein bL25 n=1 Tax=Anoxybacillus andreesenii TaxID=1325932 RepID=A0ABT9V9Y3_9BACL|nr:50S ribosomal protein L25/general stress protein Ctc [Robertmurraya andreesenii]MDQ0157778.1 large subunit ribosomal protein L25 [Robertmurraya andreesenii]
MSTALQATERTEFRNSTLTKIRKEGNIPAVVYGNKVSSTSVYVNGADFLKKIREVGRNGVFPLDLNGKQVNVILTEYQADPVKNEILHADLLAVDMSKEITADVRVNLVGEAAGVKDGGVMQLALHEVSITATPANIPSAIDVDVSHLQVGETITVGELSAGKEFQINHEAEQTIVSILPPKVEVEIDTGEEQEEGIPKNEEGRETEASEEKSE